MKAIFNNIIIAESDITVSASGYNYFPLKSVKMEFLKSNEHSSVCPLKGTAKYFDVVVQDKKSENAAWHYPLPKTNYLNIKNHIAFWKDVKIIK